MVVVVVVGGGWGGGGGGCNAYKIYTLEKPNVQCLCQKF